MKIVDLAKKLFQRPNFAAKPVYHGAEVDWEKYHAVRGLLAKGASDEDVLAEVGELGTQEVMALLRADGEMKEEFYGGGPSSYSPADWEAADRTEAFALRLARELGII